LPASPWTAKKARGAYVGNEQFPYFAQQPFRSMSIFMNFCRSLFFTIDTAPGKELRKSRDVCP